MCRGGRVDAGERATEMMELVTGVKGVTGGPQMERKEKQEKKERRRRRKFYHGRTIEQTNIKERLG